MTNLNTKRIIFEFNFHRMNRKINLLITFSVVALIALSIVQCYLVKTTYDYKVAQFHSEIKKDIAKITNDFNDIDSAYVNKKELLYNQLAQDFILDKKTKFDIKNTLIENESNDALTNKLKRRFKRDFPNINIDFAIVLNKFVLYNSHKKTDTIFSEKPLIQNKIYGNLKSLNNAFLVRNYASTTNGSLALKDYKLLTEDAMYVSVIDWEMIIFERMKIVLLLSLVSILTIITLFVIAIKALIKQKKVSDIKTDFINNITHELKTPLTTLGISTKILERKDIRDNEAQLDSVLNTITRQNHRLQNLIDQVMANSLGENEIDLQKEKIVAESFLNAIISDFQVAFPKVTIETHFNTTETILFLDKFHLTTAILNVLENAVKYDSDTIIIKTELIKNHFNISIKDDGIGISKNKHSLLFDKFYRVEQGNLHNAKGLGLGLYYVKQIIKAHQGTIGLISDLGKGAEFTIVFKV